MEEIAAKREHYLKVIADAKKRNDATSNPIPQIRIPGNENTRSNEAIALLRYKMVEKWSNSTFANWRSWKTESSFLSISYTTQELQMCRALSLEERKTIENDVFRKFNEIKATNGFNDNNEDCNSAGRTKADTAAIDNTVNPFVVANNIDDEDNVETVGDATENVEEEGGGKGKSEATKNRSAD